MKKNYIYISTSVIIIVLLVSVMFISAKVAEDRAEDGVKYIKITEKKSGEKILSIDHGGGISGNINYSIRRMYRGEKEYLGERLVEGDGTLGKYRIEIMFYDAKASPKLAKEYPLGKVHNIKDVSASLKSKYKIRIAYPADDTKFIIYIGSDEPISFKEQGSTRVGRRRGRIELILSMKTK